MSAKIKSVLWRIFKVFTFSGVTGVGLTCVAMFKEIPKTWVEMIGLLNIVLIVFVWSGIAGVIAGFQKWSSWVE